MVVGRALVLFLLSCKANLKSLHPFIAHIIIMIITILSFRFPKSSEQYRIRGKVQFIGKDGPLFANNNSNSNSNNNNDYFIAERKQAWGNLSDPAREQFYWKDANYLGNPSDAEIPPGGRDEEGKVLPPPEAFLLMFLYPTKVDYLRLGDNYRQVDEVAWGNDNGGDGGCYWKSMQVTP